MVAQPQFKKKEKPEMPKKQAWAAAVVGEWRSISPGEFEDSDDDVREGDHVVGVLGHELRQMWTLFSVMTDSVNTWLSAEGKRDNVKMPNGLIVMNNKAAALSKIFWVEIMEEFPELVGKTIGVRKSFKVVWFEEKKNKVLGILDIHMKYKHGIVAS